MTQLIREMTLKNGLTVRFANASKPYFGDYHHVKVVISCEVPLSAHYFADENEFGDACRLLGKSPVYQRTVEKMGVPSTEVVAVLERLIAAFAANSFPYLASPVFPHRFVHAELAQARKKSSFHYGARH